MKKNIFHQDNSNDHKNVLAMEKLSDFNNKCKNKSYDFAPPDFRLL